MREFCWHCHRPAITCFCAMLQPFTSSADFALIVHPSEVKSTVGTAWILRRSISNMKWFRSNGVDLDTNPHFLDLISAPESVPFLLFPSSNAFNLSRGASADWNALVPTPKRPLFIVVDGTWTQARAMLRKSNLLRSLQKISFDTTQLSQYGFKLQPHPDCLASVEGVHRVIEVLSQRGWGALPLQREHDQMIKIFKQMVTFQLEQELK